VVVVVIGSQWLEIKDEHSSRLIDQASDWVRRELLFARDAGKLIVPVVLDPAQMPGTSVLPDSLHFLSKLQCIRLAPSNGKELCQELIDMLRKNGILPHRKINFTLPPIDHQRYRAMNGEELAKFAEANPAWTIQKKGETTGIERSYAFDSFPDAFRFSAAAAWEIAQIRHYPSWTHQYVTVSVHYTTWDLENRISDYDLRMAKRLDEIYALYRPTKENG